MPPACRDAPVLLSTTKCLKRKMERYVSCLEPKNVVGRQTRSNDMTSRRNRHGQRAEGTRGRSATSDTFLGSQKLPPKWSKRTTARDRQRVGEGTVNTEPTKSLNSVDNYACQHLEVAVCGGDHDVMRGPKGRPMAAGGEGAKHECLFVFHKTPAGDAASASSPSLSNE